MRHCRLELFTCPFPHQMRASIDSGVRPVVRNVGELRAFVKARSKPRVIKAEGAKIP